MEEKTERKIKEVRELLEREHKLSSEQAGMMITKNMQCIASIQAFNHHIINIMVSQAASTLVKDESKNSKGYKNLEASLYLDIMANIINKYLKSEYEGKMKEIVTDLFERGEPIDGWRAY